VKTVRELSGVRAALAAACLLTAASVRAETADEALDRLIAQCEASGRWELREEARHAAFRRHWMVRRTKDPALVELEKRWLCRGLEERLGVPLSPVEIPKPVPPAYDPPPSDMTSFKPVKLRFDERVDLGDGYSFGMSTENRRSFVFVMRRPGTVAKDAWPGGVLTLKLWVPVAGQKGRWRLHEGRWELGDRPWKWLAGGTPSYTRYFAVRHRFGDPARDTPRFTSKTLEIPERYCWRLGRHEKDWTLYAELNFLDFFGQWPMLDPELRDECWYLEATYDGKTHRSKLLWPRGTKRMYATFCGRIAWWTLTSRYENARSGAYWYWDEEDPTFSQVVLDPLVARNANLAKVTHCEGWQTPPKVQSESDAVKELVYPQLGRLLGFSEELERERFRYLCDRIAGRKIERPKPPPEPSKEEAKAAAGPKLESDGEKIELDDEVF